MNSVINSKPVNRTHRRKARLWRAFYRRLWHRLNSFSNTIDSFLYYKHLEEAGVKNLDSIPTWTKKRELRALFELASNCSPGAVGLEIGAYLGASTCCIAAGLARAGGQLYCVDTWQNETMPEGVRETYAEFQKNIEGVKATVTPVCKRSEQLSPQDIQIPLSFIYIDGDHRYEAVRRDFELVKDWLTSDGIIAFHDFSNNYYEGVTRVVGEALASGQWRLAGLEATLAWITPADWSQPDWLADPVEAEEI